MSFMRKSLIAAAVGLAAANYSGVASADVKWTFSSGNCAGTTGGSCSNRSFSSSRTYNGDSGSVDVIVTGWANTTNSGGGTNNALELGQITQYGGGGLGIRNSDWNSAPSDRDNSENNVPEHAIDNDDRFDLVLFDFGTTNPVTMTDIQIGWVADSSCPTSFCDADISLLAYEGGSGGDTPVLDGRLLTGSSEDLRAKGWTLIDNYDMDPTDGAVNLDPDGGGPLEPVSSRYWIVMAHSNAFGTSCVRDSSCANDNDYFKIKSVSGLVNPPPPPPPPPPNTGVPVPAPLVLLGLGLVGLGYSNRRKNK